MSNRVKLKWIIIAASFISLYLIVLFVIIFPWSEMKEQSFKSEIGSSIIILCTIVVTNIVSICLILFDIKKDMVETECFGKTLYLIRKEDEDEKNQESYLSNINTQEVFTNRERACLQEICKMQNEFGACSISEN